MESKYIALENKHAQLNKEQEDLLICLAEQEESISKYRTRLIDLGQTVTDDEGDEDEDEDEEDEEEEEEEE